MMLQADWVGMTPEEYWGYEDEEEIEDEEDEEEEEDDD